jgi:fluoroacetyl-CoA thioesterase
MTEASGVGTTLTQQVTVQDKDTVRALLSTMPPVAATPWLVGVSELACYRLAEKLLEPGMITVGSRVVIDHLGPSKVGAVLSVEATLRERDKNKFHFVVRIQDGAHGRQRRAHPRRRADAEDDGRAVGAVTVHADAMPRLERHLSSRCLSPGSIDPRAPEQVDSWVPATSAGMTLNVPAG